MNEANLTALRIAVVDDSAHSRRTVRSMLNGFGCRDIYEAEDGVEALDILQHVAPDVVITDLVMPIFTGIELVKMIRAHMTGVRDVPIIILTAYPSRQHILEARRAGADVILAKPVSPKALYDRVVHLIRRPRSRSAMEVTASIDEGDPVVTSD